MGSVLPITNGVEKNQDPVVIFYLFQNNLIIDSYLATFPEKFIMKIPSYYFLMWSLKVSPKPKRNENTYNNDTLTGNFSENH